MEWFEPRYAETHGVGTKDFMCVEGWLTKETAEYGIIRTEPCEYYWFDKPSPAIEYLVRYATGILLGEHPDRLYRVIRYKDGRTTV